MAKLHIYFPPTPYTNEIATQRLIELGAPRELLKENQSRAEVIRTFLTKSIYDPEAQAARRQLIAVPFQVFEGLWSGLTLPRASRMTFGMAQQRFIELIEELFGLLEPVLRRSGIQVRPLARSFGYGAAFSSGTRHLIIEAGRAGKMIEASYHGVRRVIEPYKLEFKIRKKDNRGFG